LKAGDRVRILGIPDNLKDPNYDLKDPERREMRSAELFRFCVGRVFTIQDFDRYGFAELEVGNSPAVRETFGKYQTIWIEPELLKRVARRLLKARSKKT
jgi:hypothetical protein